MDLHELYRAWLSELWHGDFANLDSVVDGGFVGHWPQGDVRGRDGLRATIEETHGMFASLTFALELGPIAQGDLVAARWTGTAESADSGTVTFVGHDILRVGDGRIVEYWPATLT